MIDDLLWRGITITVAQLILIEIDVFDADAPTGLRGITCRRIGAERAAVGRASLRGSWQTSEHQHGEGARQRHQG
ncbi:MAG: hypothetical protein ABIY40_07875 [Rhodanobacteraceae bacterium]|nr:hypothetical protein [Pseudomonadota bacterium]